MNRGLFLFYFGMVMFMVAVIFAVAYGSNSSNMTLDCVRMFYSDEWNKGYITSLAEFCSNGAPR